MGQIQRIHLQSNQFAGIAVDILLILWVANVMWILVPYTKRWQRRASDPADPVPEENDAPNTGAQETP